MNDRHGVDTSKNRTEGGGGGAGSKQFVVPGVWVSGGW